MDKGEMPKGRDYGKKSSDWKGKGKEVVENVQKSVQKSRARLRAEFHHMRFYIRDYRKFANTDVAQESAEKLKQMRRRYRLPESGPQAVPSDSPYDQPGPSDSRPIEADSQVPRTLTSKEVKSIYDVKHEMKLMEQLHPGPIEPPTGDPYAPEDILGFISALQRSASAYIKAEAIDCNFTEYFYELNMAHDYLARSVKPGEALGELKKLADSSHVYDQLTGNLIENFGKRFPEAAQIIRKSPQAMQLVDEAAKAGVVFGGYAEDGPVPMSHAYTHTDSGLVYIPRAATDPLVATKDFLFELINTTLRSVV